MTYVGRRCMTALPILGTISPAQPKLDDAAGVSQAPAPVLTPYLVPTPRPPTMTNQNMFELASADVVREQHVPPHVAYLSETWLFLNNKHWMSCFPPQNLTCSQSKTCGNQNLSVVTTRCPECRTIPFRNDATRRTITQLQTRQECQVEPSRNDTTTTSWMILCRHHASTTFWLLRRQADQRSTKTMSSLCPTWLRRASDKCFPRC